MLRLWLTLILLFSFFQPVLQAKSLDERFARIENNIQMRRQIEGKPNPVVTIRQRMNELQVPGLSVAVAVDGKLVFAKGYGYADIAEQKKVTTNTLFQAASVSKPIAAFRALQLAQQGKIDLDTDVNQYLSEWQVHYNVYTGDEKVTTRRLLNHTAGANIWGFDGYQQGETMPNTLDILRGKGNSPAVLISGEPGRRWLYSGGGYTILQYLYEETDQLPFAELMHRYVLVPLGMNGSVFHHPLPQPYASRAATGYNVTGEQIPGKWLNYPFLAAGGLWSTPSDIIQFPIHIQKIKSKKLSEHQALLSYESVVDMLTPGLNEQGLGPRVTEHTFEHNGSSQGFRSVMVAWLEHDVAVVAQTNIYDSTIINEFVMSVAQEFDLPGYEPELIKTIDLPAQEKQKFVGVYDIPELGKVTIKLSEEGLTGIPDFFHKPYRLFPESTTVFVNIATGTRFEFLIRNEEVIGFETHMVRATKTL